MAGAPAFADAVRGRDGWAHPGGRRLDCAVGSHATPVRPGDRGGLLAGLPARLLRMSRPYPAALFLPSDAFDTGRHQVMGRRVAGRSFALGITASLQEGEELTIVAGSNGDCSSLQALLQPVMAQGCSLKLTTGLGPDRLMQAGCLHLPDPGLARWSRVRAGVPSHHFSITGVTHTLCSNAVLEALEQLPQAPLEPWDALVCTSRAAHGVVSNVLETQREVLERRFGTALPAVRGPQMPVIPLAIDPTPFDWRQRWRSRADQRKQARQRLGIATDKIVVLYVGRLSFHSKAHPISLYQAIDRLNQSGKLLLLECGHIFNAAIEAALSELASGFHSLSIKRLGGRQPATEEEKQLAFAAADVFCSPADNLQETFGLSLLEAMAAELPVVASDWSGYRDLVIDGVNGLLVPTGWFDANTDQQDPLETNFRLGLLDYDSWVGLRSLSTCVDQLALTSAISKLIESPDARQRMGLAGRHLAQTKYNWETVSRQYRELWEELANRRSKEKEEGNGGTIWPTTSYQRVFNGFQSASKAVLRTYKVEPNGVQLLERSMHQAFLTHWVAASDHVKLTEWLKNSSSHRVSLEECNQKLSLLKVNESHQMDLIAALIKLGALTPVSA